MAGGVWSFLADRAGVDRTDPATWSTTRPTGFQPLSRAGGLDRMWSEPVNAAVEDLIGTSGVHRERPRVLMTFPDADEPWRVPSAGWHFDYVPPREPGLRALQVFVVLNEVVAGGGATVVLTGLHRLVQRYVVETASAPRPKLVREHFSARDPWLKALWTPDPSDPDADDRSRRVRAGAVVDGVSLRLVEATGAAGDVYLMHSDCFHAVAPNTRALARIMATSVVTRWTPAADRST